MLLAVSSAIRTVILPRAAPSLVTRGVFRGLGVVFRWLASGDYARRDRVMSLYSPLGLVSTLAAWLLLTFAGFGFIFWGLEGEVGVTEALELSGSSLFTLGFLRPETFWVLMVSYIEAAIGLFLLALLITYLPSMYGAFSRREVAVTALSVRAGEPPSGREMIWRYWRLERMDHLREVWREWERWFVDVEETHTSLPALVFFRSPLPDHSWVTAAGAVLDGAALTLSSVNVPRDVEAEFCIRAGYLCLRRVADYFRIPYDPDPTPGRAHLDHASGVGRGGGLPRERRGADQARPRAGMARLRRVARQLRHGAPGLGEPHDRAGSAVELGSVPGSGVPPAADGRDQAREAPAYVRPGLNTMSRTISTSTT